MEPLGDRCYQRLWPVAIDWLLPKIMDTTFINSGGTNGWVCKPDWLQPLYESLGLDGTLTFAMARKLPAYQGIPPHVDLWENLPNIGRRFHVPLVSHPDVKMAWPDDGVAVHLEVGWLWEVNFHKLHEVVHLAPVDRIHAHFNVVG